MESFLDPSLKKFEDVWNQNVSRINNSTLKHFYETSLYHVELKLLPRKKRTAAHVLPVEPLANLPIHTKEMVHFYTSDYVVAQQVHNLEGIENVEKEVKRKVNHEYEVDFLGRRSKTTSNNSIPTHSSSSMIKDSVEHDNLLLSLLQNQNKANEKMRSRGRQACLFTLCSTIDDDSFKYLRVRPHLPEESINGRILVECHQLKLELEVEPIYASMALYDLTTKKKLSENFHFDMNSESLKKMLPTYDSGVADSSTLSHSGIFRISYPTSGLYLLIRLEKVLQGDVDKCSKPYLKQLKISDKLKEKTALYCWRLGKYRMPFAWTAISVKDLVAGSKIIDNPYRRNTFESKTSAGEGFSRTRHVNDMRINTPWSKNLDNFSAVTLKLRCFFKQEMEYLSDTELLGLVKQASSRKKQDLIPGSLQLRISPCPTEMKCCLSPEMVAINPCPGENNPPIRELLEFPYKEIIEPYLSYRNLMYIYPKYFSSNGRQGQIRNITVKIELREVGQKASIPLIYGKSSGPKFVSKMYTTVSYHKRNPDFYDEIKLNIPGNFNKKYFILFEFYHLNCSKKSDLDVEKCFGFSWIPLFMNSKLTSGNFELPVMKGESLIANFCELPVIKSGKGMENQKGVFKVMLKAISSVHPSDEHVDVFLKSCSVLKEISFPKNTENVDANAELIFSIVQLPESDTRCLVKFLPILLNKIIWLIINSSKHPLTEERVGKRAFKTLVQIVNKVALHGSFSSENYVQNATLVTFVHYQSQISHVNHEFNLRMNNLKSMQKSLEKEENQFMIEDCEIEERCYQSQNDNGNTLPKLLHEELLFHLNNSERNTRELALNNIWFYFDLIIKSVIEDLHWKDKLNAPREFRVSGEFMKSTSDFLEWILVNTHQKPKSEEIGTHLVISVAHFLCDLLCLVDRGWVFSLIQNFSNKIPADLQICKLDFLQVICYHHQFIPLNLFGGSFPLPFNGCIDSGKDFSRDKQIRLPNWATFDALYDLSSNFKTNYFLAGLLLANFQHFLTSGNSSLHEKSITGMYNLISKLDRDPQHQHPSEKTILASLFYPIIGITMRALPRFKTEDRKSTSETVREPEQENVRNSAEVKERRKNVTKSSFFIPVDFEKYSTTEENFTHFSFKETCGLLMCFIWVMKNIDKKIFKLTLSDLSSTRIEKFLDILTMCLICFEYKERKLVCKKKYSTSLNNLSNLDSYSQSSSSSKRVKSELITGSIFPPVMDSNRRTAYEFDRSGEFYAEVSLIILDCLEMMAEVFSGTKDEKILLEMVFKTLLEAIGKNQSTSVLDCIFYTQRSFVRKFPHLFYDDESDLCKDLSLRLLCHCSSILGRVRAQASLSLYLLLRESYQTVQKFSWVKLQLTVALSNLVDTSTEIREDKFHESLKNVVRYAEADELHKDTQFPSQVKELVKSLHVILSDTIKMKEAQPDTDLVLDLMHRIADAHRSSPNARLTWLFHMAQRHNENEGHAEAAMCMIHGSAIVAEYMSIFESKPYFPKGAMAFENISPNALEESLHFEDGISIEEGGLGKYFTESGLVGLLELAATSFFQAKLYEAMNAVYKIMIPIAEAERNYKKLANIHSKLYDAFSLIEKNKNKRVFGSFYRVAFYGNSFGELNGNEFIYKEPTLTKLSEIFNRLQTFYQERFGAENVIIVKDSNLVDENTLSPSKLYIQITYVEPYFEMHELESRVSAFEKNFTIKKFVYATPFTPHGGPHGSIGEQWIRKTFLTTSHHFPYIKRRVPIIEKDEVVLTPIEVAIENIQNKTSELAATVTQEPPDAKMLQMVLQGCIGTTVNQGPKEVAVVFLSDLLNENAMPTNFQNRLRDSFTDFAKYCYDGLKKNEKIILPEQICYQQELEKNFWKFIDYLEPLTNIKDILNQEKGVYFRKETETEC